VLLAANKSLTCQMAGVAGTMAELVVKPGGHWQLRPARWQLALSL
jgi:hypothetical protein